MEPAQVEERIRRANDIGKAPKNPANRITITLQPPPHDEQFPDKRIVKVIGHNCMDGWPDSAVTWDEASQLQKTCAWEDFQKRFTWDASINVKVKEIYARKCAERTKVMFHTARTTARKDAEKAHPGQAQEHIQDFPPWWCDRTLWAEMCQKWSGEKWTKKSKTASTNRASGTLDGMHAPATYMGGTKSQVQYMKEEHARSEGGPPRRWTEVYESLRTNLPGANEPCTRYDQMMAEKYPDASSRPDFDQGLWYSASGGKKKGYVKGLGFKQSRPSNFTTCTTASSSAGASTATSCAPTSQQAAQEIVTTLCTDRNLLQQLQQALLSAMSTADIGRHLADRAQLQGSANTESSMPPPPPPPPPPPGGAEGN